MTLTLKYLLSGLCSGVKVRASVRGARGPGMILVKAQVLLGRTKAMRGTLGRQQQAATEPRLSEEMKMKTTGGGEHQQHLPLVSD